MCMIAPGQIVDPVIAADGHTYEQVAKSKTTRRHQQAFATYSSHSQSGGKAAIASLPS